MPYRPGQPSVPLDKTKGVAEDILYGLARLMFGVVPVAARTIPAQRRGAAVNAIGMAPYALADRASVGVLSGLDSISRHAIMKPRTPPKSGPFIPLMGSFDAALSLPKEDRLTRPEFDALSRLVFQTPPDKVPVVDAANVARSMHYGGAGAPTSADYQFLFDRVASEFLRQKKSWAAQDRVKGRRGGS
jgi:hypothetical protein